MLKSSRMTPEAALKLADEMLEKRRSVKFFELRLADPQTLEVVHTALQKRKCRIEVDRDRLSLRIQLF